MPRRDVRHDTRDPACGSRSECVRDRTAVFAPSTFRPFASDLPDQMASPSAIHAAIPKSVGCAKLPSAFAISHLRCMCISAFQGFVTRLASDADVTVDTSHTLPDLRFSVYRNRRLKPYNLEHYALYRSTSYYVVPGCVYPTSDPVNRQQRGYIYYIYLACVRSRTVPLPRGPAAIRYTAVPKHVP
jgi:hypothetical protein